MNSPGVVKVITPAQVHISMWVLSKVGWLSRITVGTPVIHGEGVIGMQGIGVRTPNAAAVAAATVGLAGLIHMPNGMMFTIGMWSMMFAAGWCSVSVLWIGRTTRLLGAIPIVHIIIALLHT